DGTDGVNLKLGDGHETQAVQTPPLDKCPIAEWVSSRHDGRGLSAHSLPASGAHIGSGDMPQTSAPPASRVAKRPYQARTPARLDGASPGSEAARRMRAVFVKGLRARLSPGFAGPAIARGAGPAIAGGAGRARYAKFDRRGYATDGSVSTFTTTGLPQANARSSAGRSSEGSDTSSPSQPSASATRS